MALTIIKNYTLGDLKKGVLGLLEKSSRSEEIQRLSHDITENQPDKIRSIHEWVRRNVRYTPDPEGHEMLTSPVKFARDHYNGLPLTGDCDCMAMLVVALLSAAGIESNVVFLGIESDDFDHAVAQAKSGEEWLMIDASSRFPTGWEETYHSKLVVR